MARESVTFGTLRIRANEYLKEIASALERSQRKGGKLEEAPKSSLGYAMFLVDVGLALPNLELGDREALIGMIGCIEQALVVIAKEQFRRKYGE